MRGPESLAAAQARIARLAAKTPVHRAFHWLHLHQPQMQQWQMETAAICAPPFGEAPRAEWFLGRFAALGLANVHLDAAGNALAELGTGHPCVLVSAHLDTVFPSGTDCRPTQTDGRLHGPGICDNAAGLSGLLGLAAALGFAAIVPPVTLLFAANVGEEGEGDLRGMRHLFEQGAYTGRIVAAMALEGGGTNALVTSGLGSRRFRLTVKGPGGHSWTDASVPNPIPILARLLSRIDAIVLPDTPRTTLNVGMVSGGTSVNSIPQSASALLDLRSTATEQLIATEANIRAICADTEQDTRISLTLESIGTRPAAALPEDSALLETIRSVDRHLRLRTELQMGSTDANLPLSLGIPAVAIGAGGRGGCIHTLAEWYDPAGRELALRRILLALLDLCQTTAAPQPHCLSHDPSPKRAILSDT